MWSHDKSDGRAFGHLSGMAQVALASDSSLLYKMGTTVASTPSLQGSYGDKQDGEDASTLRTASHLIVSEGVWSKCCEVGAWKMDSQTQGLTDGEGRETPTSNGDASHQHEVLNLSTNNEQ